MNLEFRRLTIENFKSFHGEAQTLDLGESGPGLHFMRGENQTVKTLGSNGSGKSSVFEALSWCLFGRTVNNLRNPDIKPWASSKPTFVGVELMIDGKRRVVARTTNPNLITIDDKPVDQGDVESLIGLRAEVAWNTIMLGQGQPLFFDLPPRDKMKMFSDVLQLERWESRSEHASTKTRELERESDKIDGELRATEQRINELVRMLADTKQAQQNWEDGRKAKLAKFATAVAEADKRREVAELALGSADLKQDSAGVEIKQLAREIATIEDVIRGAEDSIRKSRGDRQRLDIALESAEGSLRDLKTAKTCPTCGAPIKKGNIAEHSAELQDKIDDLKAKLKKWPSEKPLVDSITEGKASLTKAIKCKREFEAKEDEARDVIDRLRKRAIEARGDYDYAVDQRKACEEESNPHREQIGKLRPRVEAAEKEGIKLTDEQKAIAREIELTKFWVKGFKDVGLYIIDEVLGELESATNELLAELGMGEWIVQYDTEKQTQSGTTQRGLDVSVVGPGNKKPVKWENWSGGEGQRLRVVGALALGDVLLNHAGVVPSLELLDEPTQHLSVEGVRDLCEMLSDRAKRLGRDIWYVDHQSVESTNFATVTTVVKTDKGSEIRWPN